MDSVHNKFNGNIPFAKDGSITCMKIFSALPPFSISFERQCIPYSSTFMGLQSGFDSMRIASPPLKTPEDI